MSNEKKPSFIKDCIYKIDLKPEIKNGRLYNESIVNNNGKKYPKNYKYS
jgi:hypothetical protein